jgi:hypothetical protein
MISSEVERTLVKSPPELWAELSDPSSLSRHLGELGEIRIVRTEPESTVEWTAENTTGTVSLKPSGWGTKVTLSVTRELDEPPALTAEEASDAASATELTPEPEAVQEPESAQEPEAAIEPEVPQDAQPEQLEQEVAPEEPEATPEARAMPEPSAPELETPPELTATLEPELTDALELEPAIASDPAPPEARRGFFARLFGRRRAQSRERGSIEDSETADAESVSAETTAASDPGDRHAQNGEQIAPADEPSAAAEPAIETEAGAPSKTETGHQSEPGDAFAAIRQALAPETFAAAHLFATRPGPGRRESTEAPSESPTADTSTPPEEPAVDIAAELLAAEEVASEQVTAVLTAVLDRLGAAHHRPFSRA